MKSEADESYLSLLQVAEARGLHYMTVYRHVRTGKLPAIKVNGEWRVHKRDLFSPTTKSHARPGHADVGSRIPALTDRLLAADEAGAWAIIESCQGAGTDSIDILHLLIVPALEEIGERWSTGSLAVVNEHTATAVALRLVGRLGPLLRSKGRTRGSIVVGAVAGDPHSLAVAIVADILRHARYAVIDLGGNTPAQSFVEMMTSVDQCRAVGLSASVGADDVIRTTVAQIRLADPLIPILVGGRSIRDRDHAVMLGSSGFASDSRLIVSAFERCIADARSAIEDRSGDS